MVGEVTPFASSGTCHPFASSAIGWADENWDWLRNILYLSKSTTAISCGACPRFHQTSNRLARSRSGPIFRNARSRCHVPPPVDCSAACCTCGRGVSAGRPPVASGKGAFVHSKVSKNLERAISAFFYNRRVVTAAQNSRQARDSCIPVLFRCKSHLCPRATPSLCYTSRVAPRPVNEVGRLPPKRSAHPDPVRLVRTVNEIRQLAHDLQSSSPT